MKNLLTNILDLIVVGTSVILGAIIAISLSLLVLYVVTFLGTIICEWIFI